MELIENLLQLLVTFFGACLAGFCLLEEQTTAVFSAALLLRLLCFGRALLDAVLCCCFPPRRRVFYVSEFGWVASVIFLRILQATISGKEERVFRCRAAMGWLRCSACR